jgi:hypothetical protein
MKLLHITESSFADQHWQACYTLLETLHDRYDSRMAKIGWEQTRERSLSLATRDTNYRRFVVFDDGSAIGWADFRVLAPGAKGQCVSVQVEAADDPAPEEFERLVAAELLRLLETCGSKSAHIMAVTEQISAIARHWNGNELNRLTRFRLRRATANTPLMRSWLEEFPRENPDLRMDFFSPVPEEHLVAYTKLFVKYIREMPAERESAKPFEMTVEETRRDIEWRRKNKTHVYTYALFDAGGAMIGHSNAVITEDDPRDVYQAMTGLNREYRGRGLSHWLKAALFFKVGQDFPANETMTTVMRAANAPIQKVNAGMGYGLLSTGHEFDLPVDGLRKFLERQP